MSENEMLERIRSENFAETNGIVLRAINIGGIGYNKLAQLCRALAPETERDSFISAVNYLCLAGYINIRRCDSKAPADIADEDIDNIEAKLSAKGLRLLAGREHDDCVRA
ncbi:MAG: type VI secretion protein [Oscillospiraceae bacterium]|nr:type VI secretion protein [Oscillospiraceae bacterium]